MDIRKITQPELPEALDLVWQVFLEFEAREYSREGIDSFKRYIDEQSEVMTFAMFGAYDKDSLRGVIATRNEGCHISLFFVDPAYHGQHIGRELFAYVEALCQNKTITVNSSPYAVPIYRRLGFHETDTEQLTNGIRYTPMEYQNYSS